MGRKLPFGLLVIGMVVLGAGLYFFKSVDEKADLEVEMILHPDRVKIPMRLEYIANVFAPVNPDVTWISNLANINDALILQNGLLLATSGGIAQVVPGFGISQGGLATGMPFTAAVKVIEYRGGPLIVGECGYVLLEKSPGDQITGASSFTFPPGSDLKIVDAFVEESSLYLLTRNGQLLKVDGDQCEILGKIKTDLARCLSKMGNKYYIGSQNGTVTALTLTGDQYDNRSVKLPDNAGEIRTFANEDKGLWIGASDGLFFFDGQNLETVRRGIMVTAIVTDKTTVWIGTFSGNVFRLNKQTLFEPLSGIGHASPAASLPGPVHCLKISDGKLYAGIQNGLYALSMADKNKSLTPVIDPVLLSPIAENYITTLQLRGSDLLVGGLNTGLFKLDIFSKTSTAILENEPGISAVTVLQNGRIAIGATTGYLEVESTGALIRKLNRKSGLIHNNVTALAEKDGTVYAATAAGLSNIDGNRVRSIYAFHGLVNNHLYALSALGDDLWVGTLGGLCKVGGGKEMIVQSCLTQKDGLPHPWITALLSVKGTLYAGTYGGGIVTITPKGALTLPQGLKTASINQNAACVAGPFICFGTLENGLLISRDGKNFETFSHGLPSLNVTALSGDSTRLAVGTDSGVAVIPIDSLRLGLGL